MSPSIGARLQASRRQQWVGREAELKLFRSVIKAEELKAEELPVCLLYVYGPGGVGKTTLLNAFAAICEERAARTIRLDGRGLEPTPDAFLAALGDALHVNRDDNPLNCLQSLSSPVLLFVDTYEALEGLDGWMREVFLPCLPENALVVLSGRLPPTPGWRGEAGWQQMMRTIPLRNLSPDESCAYLLQHAIPPDQHHAILEFTHGYPLALSLVADVFAQKGSVRFDVDEAQNVVQALLERLLQKAPDADHRAALETCALVHLTTEGLLAELNPDMDAPALFQWLRELSFMETGWRGLFPHDVAREALLADLRWRNPERYADLHRRARDYYTLRLNKTQGQEQQRILMDYIFLHRDNAIVRSAFQWQESAAYAEAARPEDWPALVAMTAKHEGSDSARILEQWLTLPTQKTIVFREALEARKAAEPLGFLMIVLLDKASAVERRMDPALDAACAYLERNAPLRPGETALYYRFWMVRDTYQDVCPIQSLIVVNMVRHDLTTPNLAFTFFPCRDFDFWAPVLAYAQKQPLHEADFTVDGRQYGVFGHDWRALPATVWMSILAEQETAGEIQNAAGRPEPLLVLSEEEFGSAVREALRHLTQPQALHASPLLRSRLVMERSGAEADAKLRMETLAALVREAVEACQSSLRSARAYNALYHTYIRPEPTQEQAADVLQLPFSTYRRHLMEGISQVIERLWRVEVGEGRQNRPK